MVNKKISDVCYPISIKMSKEMRNGTLILNVIHGNEMEIEYAKNEIIDKINSFFGYNCIGNIKLRIVQNKIENYKINLPKIKDFNKIEEKMNKIKNDKLKYSLNNLLKAYNENDK